MVDREPTELLRGTLDLMILRTLALEPMHGHGIQRRLSRMSDGVFEVQAGSMFPALYRLVRDGWIEGTWGMSEKQPQSQVLPDHRARAEAARTGDHRLAPRLARHRPAARRGEPLAG